MVTKAKSPERPRKKSVSKALSPSAGQTIVTPINPNDASFSKPKLKKATQIARRFRTILLVVRVCTRLMLLKYEKLTAHELSTTKRIYDHCGGITTLFRAQQILAEMGHGLTVSEMESISADTFYTPGHVMNLVQFRKLLMYKKREFCRSNHEDVTLIAFVALGGRANGQGNIDTSLLRGAVQQFGLLIDIDTLIGEFDKDHSGCVDFGEFTKMFSLNDGDTPPVVEAITSMIASDAEEKAKEAERAREQAALVADFLLQGATTPCSPKGTSHKSLFPPLTPVGVSFFGSPRDATPCVSPPPERETTTRPRSASLHSLSSNSPHTSETCADPTTSALQQSSSFTVNPKDNTTSSVTAHPIETSTTPHPSPKKEKKSKRPPSFKAFLGRTVTDLDNRGRRDADIKSRQKADRRFRVVGATSLPPCFTPPSPAHDHWNAPAPEIKAAVLPPSLASRIPFEVRLQVPKLPPMPRRALTPGGGGENVNDSKGTVVVAPFSAVPLASMQEVRILKDGSVQWGQWLQGGVERGQKAVAPLPTAASRGKSR